MVTWRLTDTFEDAVKMNNHVGKTWAEIVGTATMKMRIATDPDDTDPVDAASIEDQPRSSITAGDEAMLIPGGDGLEDGAQHVGTYKGILGTVFCAGADCEVATGADGETLTGSWFFTPRSTIEWYVRNAADTAYQAETLYARFGHWLTTNNDGETEINTYAMTRGNRTNINVITLNTAEDLTHPEGYVGHLRGACRRHVASQGIRCSR